MFKVQNSGLLKNGVKPFDSQLLQGTTRNKSPCIRDRFFCTNQKASKIIASVAENMNSEYIKIPGASIPRQKKIPFITDKILDAPEVIDDFPSKLIDFSNNNRLVVALGATAYVCDGDKVNEIMQQRTIINSVAWWANNVLISGAGKVELWDCQHRMPIRKFENHTNRCVALAAHEKILATGGYDGIVKIYDYRTKEKINEYHANHGEIYDLKFSLDGTQIASSGSDCAAIVMSHNKRKYRYHFKNEVQSICWMPQGVLVTGENDNNGTIQLIHTRGNDNDRIKTISGFPVGNLAWTENWGLIVSHHCNSGIWELYTSDLHRIAKYQCHKKPIMTLAATSDGSQVATISLDETLRIYELSTSIRTSHPDSPSNREISDEQRMTFYERLR